MNYDVFNGDADGICALIQLRLHQPQEAKLITGTKRDIQLLTKFNAKAGDQLTVLDISLQKNIARVELFLETGASIFYVDHHQPGDIPIHPGFSALINTDNTYCTSLIINQHLQGKYPLWAIAAAFGDNITESAINLANELHLAKNDIEKLKKLGTYVNYNGYGSDIDDLHFAPDALYLEMTGYPSPLDFVSDNADIFYGLEAAFQEDMQHAKQIYPYYQSQAVAVYLLPDTSWARRVNGVFGNELANQTPSKAHAVITQNSDATMQVGVRAPLDNKTGADEICSTFLSGGGRKSAAGINHLPLDQLDVFIRNFDKFYMQLAV